MVRKRPAARAEPARHKRRGPKAKARPTKVSRNFKGLPIQQITARVREHLSQAGYDPVLTGRTCAAIYVGHSVRPESIDFVLKEYEVPELAETMSKIGFKPAGLHTFASRSCPVDVVFSPPPLAVGDDLVKEVAEVKVRGGRIRLLNPTDCVRQRLSMFYRWGDRDAFAEALAISSKMKVDMDLVRRWSDWEWCAESYQEFEKELRSENSSKVKGER
jgi:hypothetical protein